MFVCLFYTQNKVKIHPEFKVSILGWHIKMYCLSRIWKRTLHNPILPTRRCINLPASAVYEHINWKKCFEHMNWISNEQCKEVMFALISWIEDTRYNAWVKREFINYNIISRLNTHAPYMDFLRYSPLSILAAKMCREMFPIGLITPYHAA